MSDTATATSKQPPVHKIRIGSVTASIWARFHDDNTYYSAKIERGYRDAKGKWKSTDFIPRDEIQNARKAFDLAHEYILGLEADTRKQETEAGEGA